MIEVIRKQVNHPLGKYVYIATKDGEKGEVRFSNYIKAICVVSLNNNGKPLISSLISNIAPSRIQELNRLEMEVVEVKNV